MRAPGAWRDLTERVAAEALDYLVIAARLLALFLLLRDHHLDAVVRMLADAAFDVVAVTVDDAGGDGEVFLEYLAILELQAQLAVRLFFLGNEDDSARVAVQAVDDAGPVVAVGMA